MNDAAISEINIMQSLRAFLRKEHSDDLWGTEEIADYMKLSKKSVQNHILGKDMFPTPVILPTGGKRWIAKEVRAWALKHRKPQSSL